MLSKPPIQEQIKNGITEIRHNNKKKNIGDVASRTIKMQCLTVQKNEITVGVIVTMNVALGNQKMKYGNTHATGRNNELNDNDGDGMEIDGDIINDWHTLQK